MSPFVNTSHQHSHESCNTALSSSFKLLCKRIIIVNCNLQFVSVWIQGSWCQLHLFRCSVHRPVFCRDTQWKLILDVTFFGMWLMIQTLCFPCIGKVHTELGALSSFTRVKSNYVL